MSPERMGGPAYWACGGEVRGRCGPLARTRAIEVARFFVDQAERGLETHDTAAARLGCRLATDLIRAIVAADNWRRAAANLVRP
jgi:hypothetical protein